ncbi:hypothetical protein LTR84_006730 [Exophiala bonariae]|uniref:Uncharacterized protein n=1 Tax=Exophiala bonariae TaxID=1690606 RepID=A0AAV9MZT1_9EURO|nr:hypothetical protein LTR84_006730 [Exophiala bonariae]
MIISNNSQISKQLGQASSISKGESQPGVGFPSIPLTDSSRRTTIFISQQQEPVNSRLADPSHLTIRESTTGYSAEVDRHPSRGFEMQHLVNKDDYLLARGANPRTGVITPGLHSASSSIDQQHARHGQTAPLPSRWRQKGDQWVSFDHGEPSPTKTPPVGELDGYQRHDHSAPQTFGHDSDEVKSSPGDHQTTSYHPVQALHPRPNDSVATFQLRPTPGAVGMFPNTSETSNGHLEPPLGGNNGPQVRRKPVGSSPATRSIDENRSQNDSGGSTGTVVRRLHFSNDIRSSSAPEQPSMRNFTPADVGKDLPSLPQERPSFEHLQEPKQSTPSPFLGPRATNLDSRVPSSKISNISGHPLAEKDLPCLPMNNGQSLLIQEMNQGSSCLQKEIHRPLVNQPLPKQQKLQGPRGGDQAYPFVRTPRPIHQQLEHQDQRQVRPLGGREMPVPIYDNPPVQAAPPMVGTEPGTRGPRAMPTWNSKVRQPVQRIDPFSQLFNTTITHTNMSMNRELPVRNGIRPSPPPPLHRVMNHERFGSLPTHPLVRPYDTSMNTGTSTGSMTSIPLQRTRPRAMTRPQMPIRAEGMYEVPQVGPICRQQYPTSQEGSTHRDLGRTDSQMWTAAYREEAHLIPQPLKPRLTMSHGQNISQNQHSTRENERTLGGLGLTRKCSRCQHGLVDINPGTASVIPTYDLQNRGTSKEENAKPSHPTGRGLPNVPEERRNETSWKQSSSSMVTHDERDHSICCPDCCKERDCHEGCLGHPSLHSTPSTSPTKSIWSEAASPSSSSEIEESEHEHDKDSLTSEKFTVGRLAIVKSAFKRSPKPPPLKSINSSPRYQHTNTSVMNSPAESPLPLGSPAGSSSGASDGSGTDGLNAAMSAAGSSRGKASNYTLQNRQRSSSSPMIGAEEFSRKTSISNSQRSVSGPRLRVLTPRGLAITCSGMKTRNVSGSSISTLELQVPGLGTLGLGVMGEMIIVPFNATKMWIRNHPQVMKLGWEILERAWQMSQVIATTAWRLWALIFVYSKTGKLKLNVAKKETTGGFLLDCVRSSVYLLMFFAVGVFAMRVLNIFIGALGLIGWLFRAFFWVARQILGFGLVR